MNPISFGKPVNVGENSLDGVRVLFPFTYRSPSTIIQGTITISATGGDLETHKLGSNINPETNEKLLSQLRTIAQKEIEIRVEKNILSTAENTIKIKFCTSQDII